MILSDQWPVSGGATEESRAMDDIAGNEQSDEIEVDGAGIADLCTPNQQDENEPIMKIPNEVSVLRIRKMLEL